MSEFHYFKNEFDIKVRERAKVVHVPGSVQNEKEMISFFSEELDFPDYCGSNWDAFEECINDLQSVENEKIYIIHETLPFEHSKIDQNIYIKILFRSVRDWEIDFHSSSNSYIKHELYVFFPERFRKKIEDILNL